MIKTWVRLIPNSSTYCLIFILFFHANSVWYVNLLILLISFYFISSVDYIHTHWWGKCFLDMSLLMVVPPMLSSSFFGCTISNRRNTNIALKEMITQGVEVSMPNVDRRVNLWKISENGWSMHNQWRQPFEWRWS